MAEKNLSLKEAFTLYAQKVKEYIAENSGGGSLYDDREVRELISKNSNDITEINDTLSGMEELLSQI